LEIQSIYFFLDVVQFTLGNSLLHLEIEAKSYIEVSKIRTIFRLGEPHPILGAQILGYI